MKTLTIKSIPEGSKLILNGDWYRKPGKGWYVASYFIDKHKKGFRIGLPADLLPLLIPGTVYPTMPGRRVASGYTGTFRVPPASFLDKWTYSQLPLSLKRLQRFADQIGEQHLFRIPAQNKVYWLPVLELARMLFFHSAEIVRAALYQGNSWQLAKAEKTGWVGKVAFTSNVPVGYMNKISFRKLFAWLLFDEGAEQSFSTIFNNLNERSSLQGVDERWTFDFQPPDLTSCEISWSGYTGRENAGEQDHCFIREIRSIAGVPSPKVMTVEFSHPDDILHVRKEIESADINLESMVDPLQIDPFSTPAAGRKRYLLQINPSGLHFDTEIDLQRLARQIRQFSRGSGSETLIETEESIGFSESSDDGSIPRADFDNLEEPEYLDASKKFSLFQSMLEQLCLDNEWALNISTAAVPRQQCRSLHLIDNRQRRYLHATIRTNDTTEIHCLEIELTNGECLSTLCFRASNASYAAEQILAALMKNDSSSKQKAMQWGRSVNARMTVSRYYLEHPEQKVLAAGEALESWMVRAADKFVSL